MQDNPLMIHFKTKLISIRKHKSEDTLIRLTSSL